MYANIEVIMKRPVSEKLVRCVWIDQLFTKDNLKTIDGTPVQVQSPGWWNFEEGPDFHRAQIKFGDNAPIYGDVEVHVFSSDWNSHHHNTDKRYDNTVLQVCVWHKSKSASLKNSKGKDIPILALSEYLQESIETLQQSIHYEEYPLLSKYQSCPKSQNLPEKEKLGPFLDELGMKRIEEKISRFAEHAKKTTIDQGLYENIMEGLGYKKDKIQFREIASRASLSKIRKIIDKYHTIPVTERIQAILFGVAKLIPHTLDGLDAETQKYVTKIKRFWESVKDDFMTINSDVDFKGMRPINFPTRRIPAMSHIITNFIDKGLGKGIISYLKQMEDSDSMITRLHSELIFEEDDFWIYRYTFKGKKSLKTLKLLGEERISILILNAILPAFFFVARTKNMEKILSKLQEAYQRYPRLAENNVTKFMKARLFGDASVRKIINTAKRQQGLIYLYNKYCDSAGCEECII